MSFYYVSPATAGTWKCGTQNVRFEAAHPQAADKYLAVVCELARHFIFFFLFFFFSALSSWEKHLTPFQS